MVFYGQGIKTAKGHCTIMSLLSNCNPLPYFSNPNLTYEGDKLGDEFGYVNYNVKWIRENRFLLKAVGTEEQECEFTKGIPWWSEWWEIFTHEGVLSQSQIDDNDISSDKLRNEYIMGRTY